MKFRELLTFEIKYQLRQVSTWVFLVVPCLLPFLLAMFSTPTDDSVYLNSPVYIIFTTITVGIVWLLTGGAIAGNAATRDIQSLQHPLTYTTPVTKLEYLGGRFMAAFTLNVFVQIAIIASFIISVYVPGIQNGPVGPWRMDAYVTTFIFIALPNAFITTSLQFAAATIERRAITAYLVGVGLFPVTSVFVGLFLGKVFDRQELWKLFDVAGVSVIADTETWTTFEHNNRLLTLDGMLYWNRVIWLSIAVGSLMFTYTRFQFAHVVARTWWTWKKGKTASDSPGGIPTMQVTIPLVARNYKLSTQLKQTFLVAWSSYRSIATSLIGIGVVLFLAFHFVVFSHGYLTSANVPQYATAMNLLHFITSPLNDIKTPLTIITILIAYFAGELIWRERDSGMEKISDTLPVSEWTLFLGKFIGLALVIALWLALLMIAALLIQVFDGYGRFESAVFLKAMLGIQWIEYVLFALMAMVVHVVINNKYLAHMVVLGVLMYMVFHSKIGIEHNLLIFGGTPGWSYSDMRGFSPYLAPWLWFKTYWIGWAIVLAAAGRLFWVRSLSQNFSARLNLLRHRLTRPTVITLGVGFAMIAMTGSYIIYSTNIVNDYQSSQQKARNDAMYEKSYGKYKYAPRPTLTSSKVRVDFFPGKRKADVHGVYILQNKTNRPIEIVHISNATKSTSTSVVITKAEVILTDDELGFSSFRLIEPLQPGAELAMEFDVHVGAQGFTNQPVDPAIVDNGSYFINYEWFPSVGYLQPRELTNDVARRLNGLGPYSHPSLYDSTLDKSTPFTDLIHLETIVTTDEDQTGVAPGNLVREWKEGNRNCFQYATSAPIRNTYPFFSAMYAIKEVQWNDVNIRYYYHPAHSENVETVVNSVQDALAYYSTTFGPYPYTHLTLAERSGTGSLNAEPGSIDYSEQFTHTNITNPQTLNLIYFGIAHEVAHQWWGAAQVVPARGEGGILISETLANYSGLNVLKANYGGDQVNRLLTMWRNGYEVPRKLAAPPLLQANDAFLGYRKGPFAMYALAKYIGFDKVNDALKHLLSKHGSGDPPLPTSLDLYRELNAATPDSMRYLLTDLFEKNVYWQLKTTNAVSKQVDDKTWSVSIEVDVNKVEVDSTGAENPLPMNDWIEVGVYSEKNPHLVYLQKHKLITGKQTIVIMMHEKPVRAGIDPNFLLIDLNLDNNLVNVTIEGVKPELD